MPFGLITYRFLTTLLRPALKLVLWRRVRAGKENPATLPERFVRGLPTRPHGVSLIWFHAASVGESLIQLEVARHLCEESVTRLGVLFTCQTNTAAEIIKDAIHTTPAFSKHWVHHSMAPVDTPGLARRFVHHWRPCLAIFAEGEIWPNLLLALRRQACPTALINARMTDNSLKGWLRWPATAKHLFAAFDVLLACDLKTAIGLSALTARQILPIGNLKTALPPPTADPMAVNLIREQIGNRKILLAASTHPGEEAIVLDAIMQMQEQPFLILAPRHPERGDELTKLLACTKLKVVRRTQRHPITPKTDILLADTLGEMGLWYRIADTVYLGGGHAPGVGGHNPLEALRLGKPVLSGPGVFNFADLMDDLKQRGGLNFVADSTELAALFPRTPPPVSLITYLSETGYGPMGQTLEALRSHIRAGQEAI